MGLFQWSCVEGHTATLEMDKYNHANHTIRAATLGDETAPGEGGGACRPLVLAFMSYARIHTLFRVMVLARIRGSVVGRLPAVLGVPVVTK